MATTGKRQLSTADERRATVMQTAMHAFAACGYYGTTTTQVAEAAGISQAYLYRLFPNKEALFVALVNHCAWLMRERMSDAVASVTSTDPVDVLAAMGSSFRTMVVEDRNLVLALLQANGAASEPAIGAAMRDCYAKQVEYVRAASRASDEQIRAFFAEGMLANVLVALDAYAVDAPWARTLTGQ
ncbi:TetR/AcrR family transcriptional regulator [Streptomyces phaeochromogenes]|uniref:TetR/AcrR family transcriptional regulator n=1 Tax=Streptomyces phaeochromogenes TaxID=1923 RepID=UPI002DDBD8B7|nr:TetR/AcrR family transcriptional regulator [Streptomyces phaeochromogenes]WRZ34532.1 TetR/AcrR family transcriptional regulator [Streptomyces phaeochromogenes]